MNKKYSDNLKTAGLLVPLILLVKLVPALPWWAFLVPVLALGIFSGMQRWQASLFLVGFFSGFAIWLGGNVFFHLLYQGHLLERIGAGPSVVVLLVSGLLGGVLTGLALYTGRAMVVNQKAELRL